MRRDYLSNLKTYTLEVHEWIVVTLLVAVLGGLSVWACISKGIVNSNDSRVPVDPVSKAKIEVYVKGAVAYPGLYYLTPGVSLKSVLDLSELLPEADMRRFNQDLHIRKGRMINVPYRQMIKVKVIGAVKAPGELVLPKGSRLMDLAALIEFQPGADHQKMSKKRKLKDGEVVEIKFL